MTAADPRGTPWGVAPPAFRLPAGARVGRVRLQVAELERSLAWYGELLGLEAVEREPGRALLGPPGGGSAGTGPGERTGLVELRERPGAAPVPRGRRLGLFHFAILLPDRGALGRFAAHVASLGAPVGASDHRVSEAFYLHDPDGLGIEVYADRPRETWAHHGREIVMTTDPLDVRDLSAAGGGEPWQGAPDGTTVGHVHLHVGSLEAASAFYHEALGLDRVVWSYPGALFLSAGGYHHHLGLNTWARGAEPAREDEARLLEWELVVPSPGDAAAALESAAAAGYDTSHGDGGPDGDGGRATDPWGTTVRVRPAGGQRST